MENVKKNLSISGSAHIPEGDYGSIHVSGSAHGDGDITATTIHISGSAHAASVKADEIRVSGSGNFEGDLTGNIINVSGSLHVRGKIEAGDLKTSGALHANDSLRGVNGVISGGLTAEVGAEFENLRVSGVIHVNGLLNADKLKISLGGKSEIGEIGGSDIEVKKSEIGNGLFGLLFGTRKLGTLHCRSIEGTNVYLENTICDAVRAKSVHIGEGCEIGRVEYTDELTVDEDATINEQAKVN